MLQWVSGETENNLKGFHVKALKFVLHILNIFEGNLL